MSTLLETALSNVLMAGLLAVPATCAGRWGRRPALTHGLWLLVLLKLVTPPLCRVPVAWPEPAELIALPARPAARLPEAPSTGGPAPDVPDATDPEGPLPNAPNQAAPRALVPALEGDQAEEPVALDARPLLPNAPTVRADEQDANEPVAWTLWLMLPWFVGSSAWLALVASRLHCFRRLVRFARPAAGEIQTEANALAQRMGLRCPEVLTLPGAISPMLWTRARAPRLILPEGLLLRLTPGQRATLLAHELAHFRRGDHHVRWLEVVILGLYWWCPLAWWARGQLHQAEEECCDAWVVALLPDAARDYALALVETIDFLSGAPSAVPPTASGAGHVRLLQRRLIMILHGTTPRSLTRAGLLAVAGLGLLLLPFVPSLAQPPAGAAKGGGDLPLDVLQGDEAQIARQIEEASRQLSRAQAKVMQDQLERSQRDLEAQREALATRVRQLQRAIEQLRVQADHAAAQKPSAGSSSFPGMPGMPGGASPSRPGTMSPYAGIVQSGKPASVEQRLDQIERKLDSLLWEITNLRRESGRAIHLREIYNLSSELAQPNPIVPPPPPTQYKAVRPSAPGSALPPLAPDNRGVPQVPGGPIPPSGTSVNPGLPPAIAVPNRAGAAAGPPSSSLPAPAAS